jgi:hypothetical protein
MGVSPAMEHARDLDAAWFEPFRPWVGRSDPRPTGCLDLALLNRFAAARGVYTEGGLPLRFVEARQASAAAYEGAIGESGAVPTRTHGPGMLHDWFNALAWLAFPCIKARLNRLHRDALAASADRTAGGVPGAGASGGGGASGSMTARRGALRDAATLLDENGALFVCCDPSLAASLRSRDWRALFVDAREHFAAGATVQVLGHGLCEKLLVPYKAVCAHAWIVELPVDALADPHDDALDARVAAQLQPDTLCAANLCPLPLLGVPGWWPANADPAFYDDSAVFRRERRAG